MLSGQGVVCFLSDLALKEGPHLGMLILVCREIKCCVPGNASRAGGDSSAPCHNGIGRAENEERKQNGFPNVERVAMLWSQLL